MSFGYEIAVTPLQLITAYCAVINGGTLLQPYLVKSIIDHSGRTVTENSPKRIRTVISKSVSDKIRKMMVGVVENGTGKEAQLENVMVGGKTGTSQRLVNNSYSGSQHSSTFVGFFPAEDPQIVCLVLVNSPKIGQYGGLVSAPIFHNIAQRLIETDPGLVPNRKKIERKLSLIDQLVTDLKSVPKTVPKSYFDPGERKVENYKQRIVFNGNTTIMPDLFSVSMRDAVAQLNELGLQYKISGSGKVVWQSLEPGQSIAPGLVCTLRCEPSNRKINASGN